MIASFHGAHSTFFSLYQSSSPLLSPPTSHHHRLAGRRCAIASFSSEKKKAEQTDRGPLGFAVFAATELLRLFLEPPSSRKIVSPGASVTVAREFTDLQEVFDALSFDYQQAYFLTGRVTSSLYAEDCYFADPTISFTGRDLYERNLKLLVPFLEEPSLTLYGLDKYDINDSRSIKASWQLRTHLKLPWRPFICVNGSTLYALDENLKIVKHIESWKISPLEAVSQIFNSTWRSS